MGNRWTRNSLLVLAFGGLAAAQDQQPPSPVPQDQPPVQAPSSSSSDGAWHRFDENQRPAQPNNLSYPRFPAGNAGASQAPYQAPAPLVPSSLTIPAGTSVTVRTTNPISTDHNRVGDAVSAVLTQPIVVNGIVVARRGQIVQGRVSTAEKAGRVSGTSKLGLELTQLVLVDGQQVPLHSQMVLRDGGTSHGRDAAAIGTTTAVGAAIGGGVAGGMGAGIGAGAGLVASTIGVLLTRGVPAVIYPETVLTFKVVDPITISTANTPDAFRPVTPQDYQSSAPQRLVSSAPPPRPAYVAPYPYPYPYYYAPAPFYYGPSFYFYGGYGYGRGYRRW